MSRSVNQVTLLGNLTRDPELRELTSGSKVCNFSLALNRSYKDQDGEWKSTADYVDLVAWASTAEVASKYLKKGSKCLIQGRIQTKQWEQDGVKRSKTEVLVNDLILMDDKNKTVEGEESIDPNNVPY